MSEITIDEKTATLILGCFVLSDESGVVPLPKGMELDVTFVEAQVNFITRLRKLYPEIVDRYSDLWAYKAAEARGWDHEL